MLTTGIKGKQELVVTKENTAKAMGSGTLEVFATPAMIALMEKTAYESVAPELEEGERIVDSPVSRKNPAHVCDRCKQTIQPKKHGGKLYTAEDIAANAVKVFGRELCWSCMNELRNEQKADETA